MWLIDVQIFTDNHWFYCLIDRSIYLVSEKCLVWSSGRNLKKRKLNCLRRMTHLFSCVPTWGPCPGASPSFRSPMASLSLPTPAVRQRMSSRWTPTAVSFIGCSGCKGCRRSGWRDPPFCSEKKLKSEPPSVSTLITINFFNNIHL